ncbi:MAG TPA: MoaD/ThiS family protein, partial [Pyrinomonadaceae bacterium]|nr:MoaD/ThiS family protein [Pyrinomonadaceae bacterium]
MTRAVNIRVLFFGAARDAVEAKQLDLVLQSPATVASAFQNLKTRFSTLERFGRSLLFAVNQEYATPDTQLKENDELAVFPPVSGGSTCDYRCPHDFFELTTQVIDVGEVARRVVLP